MKKVIFKSLFTSILLVLGLSVGVKQTTHEVVEAAEGDTYTKVTDVSELVENDVIIIVSETKNKGLGASSLNGKYRECTDISFSGELVLGNTNIQDLILEKGVDEGTFSFNTGEGYLEYHGSGNDLYTMSDKTSNSSWTISVSNGDATILNAVSKNRKLQYNANASSPRFACYTSNQTIVQLYKKVIEYFDYTATLHYNDDTTPDGSITSVDGKFTAPETPTRTGYVFDGWYTDDAKFENLFDFENTFATENIHLYAKWVDEKDTYLQTTSFALGFDYAFSGGNEVTSLEQLISGNTYYLCASLDSTNVATNTLDSNKLTTVNSLSEGNAYKFVNNGIAWDILDPITNKYLVFSGDNTDLNFSENSNGSWIIEYINGEFSIKANDSNKREILYRTENNVFGNYSSQNANDTGYSRIKIFSEASYSFSNYALRFGTEITTENYAKLGKVVSYGVLVAPTARLEGSTFKERYEPSKGLEDLVNTFDALNITNAKMQTTETGYSFGGLLQNVPETQIHTSVSAACYVVNEAGEIFFAEQKDMSIVGAATYYAEHAAELGLNETETTLVNVLKGM